MQLYFYRYESHSLKKKDKSRLFTAYFVMQIYIRNDKEYEYEYRRQYFKAVS